MAAYPKTLRDVPDDNLADLVAERECPERCSGLKLFVRWLAARDVIEWLPARQHRTTHQPLAQDARCAAACSDPGQVAHDPVLHAPWNVLPKTDLARVFRIP